MTTHQSQPRKVSLVNELSNMDQEYIYRRINFELNRIGSNEYHEVLKIFNERTVNMKNVRAKQTYMLGLLDVVNQRIKEPDTGIDPQHRAHIKSNGCPTQLASSAEPATRHAFSGPPPPPPTPPVTQRPQSGQAKDEKKK